MNNVYYQWIKNGMPRDQNGSVDHDLKMFFLWRTIQETNAQCFIESGTSHGDGVEAILPFVSKVISIEAHKESFDIASSRFSGNSKVDILFGNSADLLEDILSDIDQSSVIWLDAHYSGGGTALLDKETPIVEELNIVSSSKNSDKFSLVIDDARGFGVWNDYPTIDWIHNFYVENFSNSHDFWLEGDEIFIVQKGCHAL